MGGRNNGQIYLAKQGPNLRETLVIILSLQRKNNEIINLVVVSPGYLPPIFKKLTPHF